MPRIIANWIVKYSVISQIPYYYVCGCRERKVIFAGGKEPGAVEKFNGLDIQPIGEVD